MKRLPEARGGGELGLGVWWRSRWQARKRASFGWSGTSGRRGCTRTWTIQRRGRSERRES